MKFEVKEHYIILSNVESINLSNPIFISGTFDEEYKQWIFPKEFEERIKKMCELPKKYSREKSYEKRSHSMSSSESIGSLNSLDYISNESDEMLYDEQ